MSLETSLSTQWTVLAGDSPGAPPHATTQAARATLPRVVLDSNVWVDILIFADPRARPLQNALDARGVEVIIDSPCCEELKRIIDYPQFARFALDRHALLAQVDNWTLRHEACTPPDVALPRCRDPDDQKFLELAARARVDWLLTKDRALLRLACLTRRDFAFDVVRPETFLARLLGFHCTAPA